MSQAASVHAHPVRAFLPNWPLAIWMVAITLTLGLVGGLGAPDLVRAYNLGFGRALGEFALILLPSFALAAALSRSQAGAPEGLATLAAPFAGAGMICPDTAYAALSPVAGRRGLDVAFGAYAGFKLLFPAGPLIVATALGVASDSLLAYGLALLIPVWAVGVLWGRLRSDVRSENAAARTSAPGGGAVMIFAPFCLMALLLGIGWGFDFSGVALADFLTQPKGALLSAAVLALIQVPQGERRECLDTAVRRTGSLLLILGAASAFGAVLMHVVPLEGFMTAQAGTLGVMSGIGGLFLLTALFKLVQGSSMATFAAVTPVAAPLVAAMDLPAAAAVLAICAGSFVAILPNDSFYWLVRKDVLAANSEARSITTLAVGASLQALTALVVILVAVALGVVT